MGKFLVCANDLNILGGSVRAVMKISEALVAASKEIGLEVNGDKTECMVMSRDQSVRRSRNVKNDNCFFERVQLFTYLGTTLRMKIPFRKKLKAD